MNDLGYTVGRLDEHPQDPHLSPYRSRWNLVHHHVNPPDAPDIKCGMRKGADIVPQVYLRAGFISGTPLDRWSKVDTPSPVGGGPENGCHQASSLGRVQASGPAKSRRHSITARCSASVPVVRFASCDRRGEWRRKVACFADWDVWSRFRTAFESTCGPA